MQKVSRKYPSISYKDIIECLILTALVATWWFFS